MIIKARDVKEYEVDLKKGNEIVDPVFRNFELQLEDDGEILAKVQATLVDICGLRDRAPAEPQLRELFGQQGYQWVYEYLDLSAHKANFREKGFHYEYEPFVVFDEFSVAKGKEKEKIQEVIVTGIPQVIGAMYTITAAAVIIQPHITGEKIKLYRAF